MNTWTTTARTFHNFLLVSQLDPDGIRRRIREARRAAGLTQEELADLLEVHKRTVENYERIRTPDYAALNRVAAVLGRPVEWFLHGEVPDEENVDRISQLEARVEEAVALSQKILERLSEPPESQPGSNTKNSSS
jgi:transcriptional regulator with XRE-family HTH domain